VRFYKLLERAACDSRFWLIFLCQETRLPHGSAARSVQTAF